MGPSCAWWLILLVALGGACAGPNQPGAGPAPRAASTSTNSATTDSAATSSAAIWVARADGSVVSAPAISEAFQQGAPETALEVVAGADAFGSRPTARNRQIAYDASRQRLWYSDDHARIASVELETISAGPVLDAFSDIALWGCSVTGQPRTFVVDAKRDRLLVSSLSGGVLAFDLGTLKLVDAIGPGAFGNPASDFRRLAIASGADTLWFTTDSGDIGSLNLATRERSGRVLDAPFTQAISIDQASGALIYLDRNGDVTSVDLGTEVATPVALSVEGVVSFTWIE